MNEIQRDPERSPMDTRCHPCFYRRKKHAAEVLRGCDDLSPQSHWDGLDQLPLEPLQDLHGKSSTQHFIVKLNNDNNNNNCVNQLDMLKIMVYYQLHGCGIWFCRLRLSFRSPVTGAPAANVWSMKSSLLSLFEDAMNYSPFQPRMWG